MVQHRDAVVLFRRLQLGCDADVGDLLHRLVEHPLQVLGLVSGDTEWTRGREEREYETQQTINFKRQKDSLTSVGLVHKLNMIFYRTCEGEELSFVSDQQFKLVFYPPDKLLV